MSAPNGVCIIWAACDSHKVVQLQPSATFINIGNGMELHFSNYWWIQDPPAFCLPRYGKWGEAGGQSKKVNSGLNIMAVRGLGFNSKKVLWSFLGHRLYHVPSML